jgi:hypothetical protein
MSRKKSPTSGRYATIPCFANPMSVPTCIKLKITHFVFGPKQIDERTFEGYN